MDHGAWAGMMCEATRSAIYLSISFNFLRIFQYHVRHGVIRYIFQYSLHVYSFYSLMEIYRYTDIQQWTHGMLSGYALALTWAQYSLPTIKCSKDWSDFGLKRE